MGSVVRSVARIGIGLAGAAIGFAIGGPLGAQIGFLVFTAGAGLILGKPGGPRRAAAAQQLQLGEQPRQAVLGRAAVAGSLVDAFNYGGKYGTDWEVLVIALADHRCDALEGFFVDDTYHAFTGDGTVAGFNGQLEVFFRDGRWDQTVPSILTTHGPGWTANDRGRGVAHVVVAYKSDDEKAKNPVWTAGRPRFRWVLRGLRCYQPRKDSTVGGSGAHRWDNPATWQWTENPIDIRHNWVRGIYAGDRVNEPGMLLIGRGLSAIEAPPANVFARANLCDEVVGGQPRYRIGGLVSSNEPFIDVESDFAAAVAGTISQPEGAVEVDPGEAKAPIAHFTDADLLVGSKVTWNRGILGNQDDGWVNTVAARFVDPGQRWAMRSAPVRRDLADVIADGGPREAQPQLDLVTNSAQAQRIAEITRRLGRLWGRAQVTLPPRFCFIEEGDWVTWQSDRRFGGATLTFRVEAWGSDRAWHHQLSLRQISASVYSDTAPLDDGIIASDQTPPPDVAAPAVGAWNAAPVLLGSGPVRVPVLRVAGASDDIAARFVVFEYIQQAAAPDAGTIWTFAASARPDVTLLDIPVPEGGTFWVAVSYVVDGIQGERRVLGPLSTAGLSFSDGSPVAPVAPANANRVRLSRMEGGAGWVVASSTIPVTTATRPEPVSGRVFIRTDGAPTASGQNLFIRQAATSRFAVTAGERLSVAAAIEVQALTGPAPLLWQFYIRFRNAAGAQVSSTTIGSGTGNVSGAGRQSAFVTVPAGAVQAELETRTQAAGAGTLYTAIEGPMVASAAAGQTVHPAFVPGPVIDAPIDAGGPLIIGEFPWDRVDGPARPEDNADVTATAQRSIVPQFPIIEIRQGEAGNVGNRVILHSARRGTDTLVGGTWSLPAQLLGAGTATINASTGTVTLFGVNQSGSYTIRYTHTDTVPTDLKVNVTYISAPVLPGSATASGAIGSVSGSTFAQISPNLEITLPSGVTSATLAATNVDLELIPEGPAGATTVLFQWQRETSPGTWADVGASATSSPSPSTFDTGLLDGGGNPVFEGSSGLITISRTITGLAAGSTQRFRLMGRISSGNVRLVIVSGTAVASA